MKHVIKSSLLKSENCFISLFSFKNFSLKFKNCFDEMDKPLDKTKIAIKISRNKKVDME